MADAAMVVLWPLSSSNSDWILSHRTAGGHSQPDYDPATLDNPSRDQWTVVPELSLSTRSYTVVSFLRPLIGVSDSTPSVETDDAPLYPTSRTTWLNLKREPGQKIIWAYSSDRPVAVGNDEAAAAMTVRFCAEWRAA